MNSVRQSLCLIACLHLVLGLPDVLARQSTPGGPLTAPATRDAPFSADGTTIVRQTLTDGTHIERTATARYYRDRQGRARVEQAIIGLEPLNPASTSQIRITVWPDPAAWQAYTLDPLTKTANVGPRDLAALAAGGGDTFALPLGGTRFLLFWGALETTRGSRDAAVEKSLGSRQTSGVYTVGRRLTLIVPIAQIGNDRPFEVSEERWESPELNILIYSRLSDPRVGVIEYRLSNVRRADPPPELFVVPSDYTIVSKGPLISLEHADSGRGTAAQPKRRR
jgi:hypothetical protein